MTSSIVKLGNVATYYNGYAFKPSDRSPEGRRIVRIQDLTGSSYETNYFSGQLPDKFAIQQGDVLISWSASLGVYVWNDEPAWLNQHIFKVGFNKLQVNKSFFVHQIDYLLKASSDLAHGATMRHLTKNTFDSLPFRYPDQTEQLHIANVLDKVDLLLHSCSNVLEKLDSLIKSRFIEMFGPNEGSVRLSTVCTLYNGDRGKNYPSGKDRVEEGIPFVNAGDLVDGRISFEKMDYITEERYKLLSGGKIERGDILYCLRGTLGKCAITDFSGGTIASSMMIIRPNQNKVLPAYLYQVLASPLVEKQLQSSRNGSTQPNLSAKSVGNYVIPLPHINRQREFTDFVARIDKLRFDALGPKGLLCSPFTKKCGNR